MFCESEVRFRGPNMPPPVPLVPVEGRGGEAGFSLTGAGLGVGFLATSTGASGTEEAEALSASC